MAEIAREYNAAGRYLHHNVQHGLAWHALHVTYIFRYVTVELQVRVIAMNVPLTLDSLDGGMGWSLISDAT